MKAYQFIATSLIVAVVNFAQAQNEIDALRYSQSFFGGSARSMGMAGSFSALGADVGAMTTNPAGLGRFSKGTFSITTGFQNTNYNSLYTGTSSSQSKSGMPIQGLALVVNQPRKNENGWKHVQTTFAFNRLASFQASKYYEGLNYQSLLDVFAEQGYGVATGNLRTERGFTTNLGWQTYALDDATNSLGTTEYFPRLSGGDSMYHRRTINSRGGISEYSMAISGNYNNRIYLGGSLNIQNIRYFEEMNHNETVVNPGSFSLRSFDYYFNLQSRGIGANVKLGVIWLPVEDLRLGISVHTPTALWFNEKYNADMTAYHDFGDVSAPAADIPRGDFKYRFQSPPRVTGSIGYVLNRLAMNVDVELVDYSSAQFRSSNNPYYNYGFLAENTVVGNFYRSVVNTRFGLEYAVTSEWFVRGGYAIYPRAIDERHDNVAKGNYFFGAGIGYRKGALVLDIAYLHHRSNSEYYGFNPDDSVNQVNFDQRRHSLVLTLGLRLN